MTYYYGDFETQDALLQRMLGAHTSAYREARRQLVNRIAKFYNLDNKYDGKGRRREQ